MRVLILFFIYFFNFCSTNPKSELQKQKHNGKKILIGNLEFRTIGLNPQLHKNFSENLIFQLVSKGYEVEKINLNETANNNLFPFAGDTFYPFYFKNSAMELNKENIKIQDLIKYNKFEYYITGSFSNYSKENYTENGSVEEVYLFLDIYSSVGKRLGIINFKGEKRNFSSPEYLDKLCKDIVSNIKEL